MKLNKIFLVGSMAIAGLASCVNEDLQNPASEVKGDKGVMLLNVAIAEPKSTRANSAYTEEQLAAMKKATNFPIDIFDANKNKVKAYNNVGEFPKEGLLMNVGNYTIESYTPGGIYKKMNYPYYKGEEAFTIQPDDFTDVDVVCKMKNSKIKVTYSQEFLDLFSTWRITIDDGSIENIDEKPEFALIFTEEQGTSPAPVYWLFDNNVQVLTVRFKAYLKSDGSPVSDTKTVTKDKFVRPYADDDSQTFTGGEQLIFNFVPDNATTGKIGISISATITFDETEEPVTLYLTDKNLIDDEGGDTPNPGGDTTGEKPTLECSGGWEVTLNGTDSPQTKIIINTPEGLKSMKVTITGGNDGFSSATGYFNHLEMVNNSDDFEDVFYGVEDATIPQEGDLSYTFPVYAFFPQILMFHATDPGKAHEFFMEVEDKKGNTANATLKIIVTE